MIRCICGRLVFRDEIYYCMYCDRQHCYGCEMCVWNI